MKYKIYLSIVINVTRLEKTTFDKLSKIINFCRENVQFFEVILVDNTQSKYFSNEFNVFTKKITNKCDLKKIILPWRHDEESSILAGIEFAVGDFVLEIENVKVFDSNLFSELINKCLGGYDVVAVVPTKSDLISLLFYKIFFLLSSQEIMLNSEPLRIISRRALNFALKSNEKNKYRKILYKKTGFPHAEIISSKVNSVSTKKISEKLSLAFNIVISFTRFGSIIPLFLASFFGLISLIIGIYAIYAYLTFKHIMEGWTTTMLFLSFGFFGLFVMLSILIRYLDLILDEVKDKPKFVIKDIEKI